MKWFKKFVSMCAVGLGGSKKEVDLVASDSTNEIDLGSHGLKGKDDFSMVEGIKIYHRKSWLNARDMKFVMCAVALGLKPSIDPISFNALPKKSK